MFSEQLSKTRNVCRIALIISLIGGSVAQRPVQNDIISVLDVSGLHYNSTRCQDSYIDLQDLESLKFNASSQAAVPPEETEIGDGHEMQCRGSPQCYFDPPTHAECLLSSYQGDDELRWNCVADDLPEGFIFTDVTIRCQKQDDRPYCVYKDSCVLFYSLTGVSFTFWITISLVVLVIAVALAAVYKIKHFRRRSLRVISQDIETSTRREMRTSALYDPPPPYQPPRNQQAALSNLNRNYGSHLSQQEAEEDPPPYSSVVPE